MSSGVSWVLFALMSEEYNDSVFCKAGMRRNERLLSLKSKQSSVFAMLFHSNWTTSRGNNNRYGGAAPRVPGSITPEFCRMNERRQ